MWFKLWGLVFFFKQKTAYEMRISDWSADVCSSDLWSQKSKSAVLGSPIGHLQRGPVVGVSAASIAGVSWLPCWAGAWGTAASSFTRTGAGRGAGAGPAEAVCGAWQPPLPP